ncbi:MAG: ABC transporter permease [Planctomycetaceae bacterium]
MSTGTVTPPTTGWLLPAWSLTSREVVRFLRQRSRLIGALAQPAIFWIRFGTGLSGSFRMPGAGDGLAYQVYFLPGIVAMIVMFTAIFSAISVIQDRDAGFLQGVLASPAPRTAIVLGKLGGGSLLAVGQGLLFIAVAPLLAYVGLAPHIPLPTSPLAWLGIVAMLTLMAVGLCGLGYFFAWRLESVQGFHAIMSVLLFPMWLLSGAFFPANGSGWLAWIIRVNPLTYTVAGLRHAMATAPEQTAGLPAAATCIGVSLLFAAACVAIDVVITRRGGTTGG